MNVTYLIGNGFDLGIGLKTHFKDFLKYYLTIKSDDEDINDFKNTIEKESINLWADLELKFGQYIENFEKDDLQCYIKIYEDILSQLNDYLNTENKKMVNNFDDDIIQKIKNDITLLDIASAGFRPDVHDNISATSYYLDNINVNYSFITFNYTTTFERMLDIVSEKTNNILYTSTNKQYNCKINTTIHIHGQLGD